MNKLLIIFSFLLLILLPSISMAFHYEDYFVEIGEGYQILTPSKVSHYIATRDGTIIFATKDYPGVGPIVQYSVHDRYIILMNYARITGTVREGDDAEVINKRQHFYSIIDKNSNQVMGPLSKTQLDSYNFINNNLDWLRVKPYHTGERIAEIVGAVLGGIAIAALIIAIL